MKPTLLLIVIALSMATGLPTPLRSHQDEPSTSTTTTTTTSAAAPTTAPEIADDNESSFTDYEVPDAAPQVQIDRFAQLVATHWQYDHLEAIKTSSYDSIAKQMREHVEIMIQPASSTENDDSVDEDNGDVIAPQAMPDDAMDVDILKAQIFGAIQAHIGGDLPLAWDEMGEQLSQPAIEAYVRRLVLQHCTQTDDHVEHACLMEHGEQILGDLDGYVALNLGNIFESLNRVFVPNLLQHTESDLRQVLDYFNTAFFRQPNDDGVQLALRVLPWKHSGQNKMAAFSSTPAPSTADTSDRHSHSISQYADLALV